MLFLLVLIFIQSGIAFSASDDSSNIPNKRSTRDDANISVLKAIEAYIYNIDLASQLQRIEGNQEKFTQMRGFDNPKKYTSDGATKATSAMPSLGRAINREAVAAFFKKKQSWVRDKMPQAMIYFNEQILAMLGSRLGAILISPEEKQLFEIYLWKAFLAFYECVSKELYPEVLRSLESGRNNGNIPCNVKMEESSTYNDCIKITLYECFTRGLLDFEKDREIVRLTSQSKNLLQDGIKYHMQEYVKKVTLNYHGKYRMSSPDDEKLSLLVDQYYRSGHRNYLNDESSEKKLYTRDVLRRITYDINDICTRISSKKESSELHNEDREKLTIVYYIYLYESFLEKIYKNFKKFNQENSANISEDQFLLAISTGFNCYIHNIFYINLGERVNFSKDFQDFLICQVEQWINTLIEKTRSNTKNKMVPKFTICIESDEMNQTVFNDAQTLLDTAKSSLQQSQPLQQSQQAKVVQLKINELLANISNARQKEDQRNLAEQSQEHDQQIEDKRLKLEKARLKKEERCEQERLALEAKAQADADKKRQKVEKDRLRAAALHVIRANGDNQLDILRQKGKELEDLKKEIAKLKTEYQFGVQDCAQTEYQKAVIEALSNVQKKIQEAESKIDQQEKELKKFKKPKDALANGKIVVASVEGDIQQIREVFEKFKKESLEVVIYCTCLNENPAILGPQKSCPYCQMHENPNYDALKNYELDCIKYRGINHLAAPFIPKLCCLY
ncbi:hypothetical protein HYV10_00745 [Candidatus Dependentiae bacterium]|nr:hypothetical protein [Candidatus Dependentiae bacterium]